MPDPRTAARGYGIAIELADLGSWGDATLVSEYDPAGPAIRINTRAIPPARRARSASTSTAPSRTNSTTIAKRSARSRACRIVKRANGPPANTAPDDDSRIVAGIDGGQSSTIAVVLDASGELLGRGTAGPSDHVDEPAGSAARRGGLRGAPWRRRCGRRGCRPARELAAVVVGAERVRGRLARARARLPQRRTYAISTTPSSRSPARFASARRSS